METATSIVIEVGGYRERNLALRTPRTIGELWGLFTRLGQRPTAIYLAGHVARVVF